MLLIFSLAAHDLVEMKATRKENTHLPNTNFRSLLETQSYAFLLLQWRRCCFGKSQAPTEVPLLPSEGLFLPPFPGITGISLSLSDYYNQHRCRISKLQKKFLPDLICFYFLFHFFSPFIVGHLERIIYLLCLYFLMVTGDNWVANPVDVFLSLSYITSHQHVTVTSSSNLNHLFS